MPDSASPDTAAPNTAASKTATIDQVLADSVAAGEVPGVTAIAANASGVMYEGAFGRRGVARDDAMTMDTVFHIASMTKAVTGVAAMQLVEHGMLGLDQPAGEIVPFLANPMVLEGFDAAGEPVLRPAKGTITLRNLLTHTAGYVYPVWNENMMRYMTKTNHPTMATGKIEALKVPLGFDPGDRWEYGINIDLAGHMVEVLTGTTLEAYLQDHVFKPLGMRDTSFIPRAEWDVRRVQGHSRAADGTLTANPFTPPVANPGFYPGGGGLFSTARDYMRFLQALMAGGALDGARILRRETVELMGQNHMGELNVRPMVTSSPAMSNDCELFPGMTKKWGLTWLINTEAVPGGRSAGSLAWAGVHNTYYWLDPVKLVSGVLMTQILPFADPTVLGLLDRFERAVYATL